MERLFEEVFVEVCAPTLRGIKPSNLFRYQPQNRDKLLEALDFWNRELEPSGLQVRALKECSRTGAFLILVYREEWLRFILGKISVQHFLKKSGYQMQKTVDGFLKQLSNRLCLEHDFPHEIGIFLGIRLRMLLDSLKIREKIIPAAVTGRRMATRRKQNGGLIHTGNARKCAGRNTVRGHRLFSL